MDEKQRYDNRKLKLRRSYQEGYFFNVRKKRHTIKYGTLTFQRLFPIFISTFLSTCLNLNTLKKSSKLLVTLKESIRVYQVILSSPGIDTAMDGTKVRLVRAVQVQLNSDLP